MQLYRIDNLSEGEYTFGSLKRAHAAKVIHLRRLLEKKYTFLAMSVAYWEADGFIDEVLRNDRPRGNSKRSRRSGRAVTRVTSSDTEVESFRTDTHSKHNRSGDLADRESLGSDEEAAVLEEQREMAQDVSGHEQEENFQEESEDEEEESAQIGGGNFSDDELRELRKEILEIRRDEDECSSVENMLPTYDSVVRKQSKRGSTQVAKSKKRHRAAFEGSVMDEVKLHDGQGKPKKQKKNRRRNERLRC